MIKVNTGSSPQRLFTAFPPVSYTHLAAYGAVAPALNIATGSQWKYTESGRNVYSVSYSTASPETSKMNITQGSTGISIEETEANKLYELGYVPIITSMTVPANTTYQTTFTFKAEGNKNGTGTALAAVSYTHLDVYKRQLPGGRS